MKRISLLLVLLMSVHIMPAALAAKPKCTNQQLMNLNQLAIDFNNNRAYFLKYVVFANEANDGLVRSRRAGDIRNEASYRETFLIATDNAKKTAGIGKRIETQIRTALAQCVSGYGIQYTSDYGMLEMSKSIKGVKFPSYSIPGISVQASTSSSSNGTTSSPEPSTLNTVKLSAYFNKLMWSWKDKPSRTMLIECNYMPKGGSISGLRAILIMSASGASLASGTQWFPKTFSEKYSSQVKTWQSSSAPFLYIELEPVSILQDPCDVEVRNVPAILGSDSPYWVGPDVGYAGLALVDSSNALALVGSFSRFNAAFTP